MEKTTILIQVQDRPTQRPKQVKVEAHRVAPGLAVHEAYGSQPRWTISHIPSGLSLLHAEDYLLTFREALDLCLLLAPLADWTLLVDGLFKAYPNLRAEILRVRHQGGERHE